MFDFPASPSTGQVYQPAAGGPVWQFDGLAWTSVRTEAGFAALKRSVFLATTTAFQYDPKTQYADIEVQGGGSGGAGSTGGSSVGSCAASAGGGAGGYAKKLIAITDAIRAATKTITVGSFGTSNNAGGDSVYTDGTNTLTGGGGQAATGNATGAWTNTVTHRIGVLGGAASGGDINKPGGAGGNSIGMGAAYLAASTASGLGGNGADSLFGAGGLAGVLGATTGALTSNGASATGYGAGGGGGGATNNASANIVGGNGSQGIVIITEYFFTQGPAMAMPTTADERNRIINPAMQISQENGTTSSPTAVSNGGYYAADQWLAFWALSPGTAAVASYAIGASAQIPGRSRYALLAAIGTAKAVLAAGDYYYWRQNIEGSLVADLRWGRAEAIPVVLSFWAWTSVAGIYSVRLANNAGDRQYPAQFTLPATTWTKVELSVPGDTAGTWLIDNGVGLRLDFALAFGSTYVGTANAWQGGAPIWAGPGQANLASLANANFLLTDVGLYADPAGTGKAPPFVVPDFGNELSLCQRYYFKTYDYGVAPGSVSTNSMQAIQRCQSAASDYHNCRYAVPLRTAPTVTVYSPYTGVAGQLRNLSAATDVALGTASGGVASAHITWTAAVAAPYCYHLVANARM